MIGAIGVVAKVVVESSFRFVAQRASAAVDYVNSKISSKIEGDAKKSIRTEEGPSSPFDPPHSHTGELRSGIQTVRTGKTFVVGVADTKGRGVPAALEHGGQAEDVWGRTVTVKPRPYMQPAGEKGFKRVDLWKDAVRPR